MEKAPCPMRGLLNDLAHTLMGSMLHFDNLLLLLDYGSEGFDEAWLANQQLQRALEFFFELRSEFMICHEYESTSQCKMEYHKLTTLDKILHKYNNIFECILGYCDLMQHNIVNIRNIRRNTKRIFGIVQDAHNFVKRTIYPFNHNSSNNKPNINYGEIKLVNIDPHKKPNNKKILLVEDDEGVKDILAIVLRQQKYSVVECSNGETALAKFERTKSKFFICIIDIELPDIEGPNLVKKLLLKNPNINVLYISGYPEITLKQKFPLINQHQIMIKPFQLGDFVNKIRSITIH
jgi:CheY-like chemotaxis protein